jgi:SAM-dependent methyltransferase
MPLELRDGIWTSPNVTRVSYPARGNAACFSLEDDSFWFANRNRLILDFVRADLPGKRFLDLGGGNGFVAKALQDLGAVVDLVEPGEGARNAYARGVRSVFRCSVDELPLVPVYDFAGLFDVIEHVDDPASLLRRVRARMAPRARLLVTVPAYGFLWSDEDARAGHFRRYTRRSLRRELERAGFSRVRATYFFGPLVPAIFLFRALPFRLGLGRAVTGRDHRPRPALRKLADAAFALERGWIRAAGAIPFGASLLAVADQTP